MTLGNIGFWVPDHTNPKEFTKAIIAHAKKHGLRPNQAIWYAVGTSVDDSQVVDWQDACELVHATFELRLREGKNA